MAEFSALLVIFPTLSPPSRVVYPSLFILFLFVGALSRGLAGSGHTTDGRGGTSRCLLCSKTG